MWETPYWLALGIWGGMVLIGSLAVLATVVLMVGDPHSGYTPKIFLGIVGVRGLAYGASQIRAAIREKHSPAKETQSE
jgi:hypothetical protein